MAEVAVAMRRAHLGADHAMRAVLQLVHVGRHDRLGEAGPAAAGLELVGRGEQRLAGNDVDVLARELVIVILPREGALGRALLGHPVLLWRELSACLVGLGLGPCPVSIRGTSAQLLW